MATRKEITKKYARQYASVGKKDKGRMLDELVGVTGWSRTNARRAITTASKCKGAARAAARKPPAPVYGYDTLKVLIELWTLIGEPCGKYLAPIMATTLAQLECGTPGPRHECGLRCPRCVITPHYSPSPEPGRGLSPRSFAATLKREIRVGRRHA